MTLIWPVLQESNAVEPVVDVCLSKLIDHAQDYQGKGVRVAGYLELRADGDALFLNAEDMKHGRSDRGVFIELDHKLWKQRKTFTGQTVLLEGVFDSKRFGNTGYYAGTLSHVNKIIILSFPEFSQIMEKCGPLTGPASK